MVSFLSVGASTVPSPCHRVKRFLTDLLLVSRDKTFTIGEDVRLPDAAAGILQGVDHLTVTVTIRQTQSNEISALATFTFFP